MQIALFHNSSAGSEDHTDARLVKLIRRAGHEVVHVVSRLRDLAAALQQRPCELVVVAGGDGTVGRAACQLADWEIPLTILPLGTANNTALTLGLMKRLKTLVRSWERAEPVPFDIALLDDGSVRQCVSEAVGWGLFPLTVVEAKKRPSKGSNGRRLNRDRKLFRSLIDSSEVRPYRIEVDQRDYSGSYVMVQVMNLPFIGPRLKVSPASDPSDGVLEVVLAGETERGTLHELARTGTLDPGALRSVRGQHVRVLAGDGVLHKDGDLLHHPPGPREFQVSVRGGAVRYLR
jgi:diacylglycerol kinase (ATP)